MRQMIFRRAMALILVLLFAAGLTACGKKSALEPPAGDKERQFPLPYPRK
jgi:predicted small lipoprotein YifL